MELYIYRTPNGLMADFRPYLDGHDHSFDVPRRLEPADARWEKIRNLQDPRTDEPIGGRLEFAGRAACNWHELLRFPIPWEEPLGPAA